MHANVDIHFLKMDILQPMALNTEFNTSFDLIVSNPPYVLENEKGQMQKNTLDYEPHLALFVSDHDPLIFYKRIAEIALKSLKPQGKLYFEINEMKGQEVVQLLADKGFSDIVLKKDLNEKNRMVRATLNFKPPA
jgi:release factor glutamine methyltransferase